MMIKFILILFSLFIWNTTLIAAPCDILCARLEGYPKVDTYFLGDNFTARVAWIKESPDYKNVCSNYLAGTMLYYDNGGGLVQITTTSAELYLEEASSEKTLQCGTADMCIPCGSQTWKTYIVKIGDDAQSVDYDIQGYVYATGHGNAYSSIVTITVDATQRSRRVLVE